MDNKSELSKILKSDSNQIEINIKEDFSLFDEHGEPIRINNERVLIQNDNEEFHDGDFITGFDRNNRSDKSIFIFKQRKNKHVFESYCLLNNINQKIQAEISSHYFYYSRKSNQDEIAYLLTKMSACGLLWDSKNKNIIDYGFKEGCDLIDNDGNICTVVCVKDGYVVTDKKYIPIDEAMKLKKLKKVFNIKKLKPFTKVLTRIDDDSVWLANIYGSYDEKENVFNTISGKYKQCVPYNSDTLNLVGTKCDAPEFYKTWTF